MGLNFIVFIPSLVVGYAFTKDMISDVKEAISNRFNGEMLAKKRD
jgi:hypothetical protein